MRDLYEVQSYLNDISCINHGGCGIAAYAMYLWLKKENKLEKGTKFVFLYDNGDDTRFFNNQTVLKEKNGDVYAPSHVCLYHNGYYIDSDTCDVYIGQYKRKHIVDESWFLVNSLCNIFTWNLTFNRKNNMSKIEKTLGIKFDKEIPRCRTISKIKLYI